MDLIKRVFDNISCDYSFSSYQLSKFNLSHYLENVSYSSLTGILMPLINILIKFAITNDHESPITQQKLEDFFLQSDFIFMVDQKILLLDIANIITRTEKHYFEFTASLTLLLELIIQVLDHAIDHRAEGFLASAISILKLKLPELLLQKHNCRNQSDLVVTEKLCKLQVKLSFKLWAHFGVKYLEDKHSVEYIIFLSERLQIHFCQLINYQKRNMKFEANNVQEDFVLGRLAYLLVNSIVSDIEVQLKESEEKIGFLIDNLGDFTVNASLIARHSLPVYFLFS
jgi:hypothetical protein